MENTISQTQHPVPPQSTSFHLDEVLFMQTRLFSMFCKRHPAISSVEMDRIFTDNGIWDFIEQGYDGLHTEGDEAIYDEIIDILHKREVKL